MHRTKRTLFVIVIALILAAVTFAYAAANTVPASGAGDGSGDISGYTVSNIHYILNVANPQVIESVTFTLTPITASAGAPTSVRIQLVSTAGNWYSCTESAGTWTCNVSGAVTVLAADRLTVVSAQ